MNKFVFGILLSLLGTGFGTGAFAEASFDTRYEFSFEFEDPENVSSVEYQCDDGREFSVDYVNATPNVFAVMHIENQILIFVNVLSASGAKYVTGEYIWWTKGDEATLENLTQEGEVVTCQGQES